MNPDITGAAACIHGYAALWGFGMTLIRNQAVEVIPVSIKVIFRMVVFLINNIHLVVMR
jgi:hypothetical protein